MSIEPKSEKMILDDEVVWRGARLRMARMVEPFGCDALVDHIIVYKAPYMADANSPLAFGRSLEREETADKRTAWRLVEVVPESEVVKLERLDGAEVYSEMIDLGPASVIPSGTTFHPERSMPVRRRLMTIGNHSGTATGTPWFSAKTRVAVTIDGEDCALINDCVFVFLAKDFDAAFDRALAIGRSQEHAYVGGERGENQVRWQFVELISLNLLGAGDLGDVVVVHNEEVPLAEAKGLPFDTMFHPERSGHDETGAHHRRRL
jgi:hypothetical protein